MKRLKGVPWLLILIMTFFVSVVFTFKTTDVLALPTTNDVFKAAPNGIDLEDFFEYPTSYTGSKTVTNPVQIIKAGSSTYGNNSDIIQLTNGDDQVASIWGTMKDPNDSTRDYNYIDLSKKQHISGWLYIGDKYALSGDGIALVLQNDANGINAISRYTGNSGILGLTSNNYATGKETLGVWGGGGSPSLFTNNTSIQGGAIQNSFALEFDAFRNETTSSLTSPLDNFFDGVKDSTNVNEVKGNHVAWGYPAEEGTYKQYVPLSYYYYGMHHNNPIHNVTISGYDDENNATGKDAWHHFSFDYEPDSNNSQYGYIKYVYNDRENDGTIKPYSTWDMRPNKSNQTIQIDRSKFNLPAGQNKIRWGFTGSTGSPSSKAGVNSLVVESIPSIADVETTTSLYDNTQKRSIRDLDKRKGTSYPDSDYTVTDGDSLTFKYDLKYNSGLKETGDITTKVQLPQHMDYQADTDGNIGKITYADSNKVTYIKATDLKDDTNKNGQSVKALDLTLDSLSKDNSQITIEITGLAKGPVSDSLTTTTVDMEHTSYDSTLYSNDVMSYSFKISNEKLNLTATNNSDVLTLKQDESVDLKGTMNYIMGSAFDGEDLSAHAVIYDKDGNKSDKEGVWNVSSTSGSKTGTYTLSLPSDLLKDGANKVELYMVDSVGRVSNTVVYNVTLKNRELYLTPDKTTIDVKDNKQVQVSGVYGYKDGLDFESDTVTTSYQVTNEDGTIHDLPIVKGNPNGLFTIDLNPIAYSKPETQDVDEYLKNPSTYDVLKEGKNTVSITVQDGEHSVTGTVVVNVPVIKPTLTTDKTDVSLIGEGAIGFFAKFTYPDNPNYHVDYKELTGKAIVDNNTDSSFAIAVPKDSVTTPVDLNYTADSITLGLDMTKEDHTVEINFSDPYARKTSTINYDLRVLQKVLQLNYEEEYAFENVTPLQTGFVERDSAWDLSVHSYKSKWILSAESDNLIRQNSDGTNQSTDLSMFYVDKSGQPTNLYDNPQIAMNTDMGNILTNISAGWDEDEGILLKVPRPQLSGLYKGKIAWNLVDSTN